MSSLDALLDVVFPLSCMGCGRRGFWLCTSCRGANCTAIVQRLGLRILVAQDPPDERATASLYALKYELQRAALAPLVSLLSTALCDRIGSSPNVVLVPVPTDAQRRRERGFDHAVLLAESAGTALHLPVLHLLERQRSVARQVGLGRSARLSNVAGVFRAPSVLPGIRPILIDDVCTTGATFRAAAEALWGAGAERVGACCLFARTK